MQAQQLSHQDIATLSYNNQSQHLSQIDRRFTRAGIDTSYESLNPTNIATYRLPQMSHVDSNGQAQTPLQGSVELMQGHSSSVRNIVVSK